MNDYSFIQHMFIKNPVCFKHFVKYTETIQLGTKVSNSLCPTGAYSLLSFTKKQSQCDKCYPGKRRMSWERLVGASSKKLLEDKFKCVNYEWAIKKQKYQEQKNLATKERKNSSGWQKNQIKKKFAYILIILNIILLYKLYIIKKEKMWLCLKANEEQIEKGILKLWQRG